MGDWIRVRDMDRWDIFEWNLDTLRMAIPRATGKGLDLYAGSGIASLLLLGFGSIGELREAGRAENDALLPRHRRRVPGVIYRVEADLAGPGLPWS